MVSKNSNIVKPEAALTDYLAIDCEMVGAGIDGSKSILARCSIVNQFGQIIYNKYVIATEPVTDYRSHITGIREGDLDSPHAIPFKQCQAEVSAIIQGRILIAHSISADLLSLGLNHPLHLIRDTALCKLLCPNQARSLKSLVIERLNWHGFQSGQHDSVEDARAVLALYQTIQESWEELIKQEQKALNNNPTTNLNTLLTNTGFNLGYSFSSNQNSNLITSNNNSSPGLVLSTNSSYSNLRSSHI